MWGQTFSLRPERQRGSALGVTIGYTDGEAKFNAVKYSFMAGTLIVSKKGFYDL